jgi:hypothetical protein
VEKPPAISSSKAKPAGEILRTEIGSQDPWNVPGGDACSPSGHHGKSGTMPWFANLASDVVAIGSNKLRAIR